MVKSKTIMIVIINLAVAFVIGCSNNSVGYEDFSGGTSAALFKIAAGPNTPFSRIADSASLTISAPDMNSIVKELVITGSAVEGTISGIPAGKGRLFTVVVYDSLDSIQYRGTAVADLPRSATVNVPINIYRVGANAVINGNVVENAEPPKLIAYWSFDSGTVSTVPDDSGNPVTIFSDISGNGYDAVGMGTSYGITSGGIKGYALECLGIANDTTFNMWDIKVPRSLDDFNLQQFSVEAWACSYVNVVNPGSFYNQKGIFNFTDVGIEMSGVTGGYALSILEHGRPALSWSTKPAGSWPQAVDDSIIQPNRWYHLVGTFGADSAMLYVNGRCVSKTKHAGEYLRSGNFARIACQYQMVNGGRTRHFFNGKIDELKIYNYVLDSATVAAIYNELKPAP